MIEMAIMLVVWCIIAIVYGIVVIIGEIVGKYGRFDD